MVLVAFEPFDCPGYHRSGMVYKYVYLVENITHYGWRIIWIFVLGQMVERRRLGDAFVLEKRGFFSRMFDAALWYSLYLMGRV